MFDNTEIEEALLLHVQAPDDEEASDRRAGPGRARDDRARRGDDPGGDVGLHGLMRPTETDSADFPEWTEPE